MAVSVVSICNMALARVGSTIPIASLNEATTEARMCNLFYEAVRDNVLRGFPWKFAMKRADLQDIGTPPINWAYRYRYPTDCLMARRILPEGLDLAPVDGKIQFIVLEDQENAAKAIATNEPSAVLEYTARVEDPTIFDANFVSVIAWALACELAIPLKVKADLRNMCERMYAIEIARATAASLNEGFEGPEPESEFIRCRS